MVDSEAKFSRTKIDNMFRLGYRLAFDSKSRRKDWDDIFALCMCNGINGHLRAQFYLATCYDLGNGVKRNVSEAFAGT